MFLICINEYIRPKIRGEGYSKYGITAINPVEKNPIRCTWICHNNTNYCKVNHVKAIKPFLSLTDPLYYGVIRLLGMTGNYAAANVIILVLLLPFTAWYFLIQSLNIQYKIQKSKCNGKNH